MTTTPPPGNYPGPQGYFQNTGTPPQGGFAPQGGGPGQGLPGFGSGQRPPVYAMPTKPPKPWFRKWWVWAVAVVVLIVVARLGSDGTGTTAAQEEAGVAASTATTAPADAATPADKPADSPTSAAPEKKARLTVDDGWTIDDSDGYFTYVRGYVSNNSDKPLTNYVQITFDVLDENGANVGQCFDNTNSIDANGKWKFKAMCTDDDAKDVKVRFKEITGF